MESFESSTQFNSENQADKIEQPPQPPVEQTARSSSPKIMENLGSAKDKISTYLKYKSLKVKEYFGQLNQKNFDQLLDFDFQEQLKDVPPIKVVFSPEDELAKIKILPKEQKGEALATFKENLARQREALAACRVFIERTIEFNNDIPKIKLLKLVKQFAAQYGFNNRQKQITEQLLDGYYENRQKVLKIWKKFSDDYELVNKLSGVNLGKDEKLNISVGPMSIDIDASGFNAGRLYEKADKPVIDFTYGGFASQSIGENPIYYVVINKDKATWNERNDLSGKNRRNHEYEHLKNKIFRAVFKYKDTQIDSFEYPDEEDMEIKKVILEDFFNKNRASALEKVRDEITASLCDRDLPTLQLQLEDFFFSGEGPYDYLEYLRNWEELKDNLLYQEIAQRMLVREYREIIESAFNSYVKLVNKGKYSTQEATALLTDKPLANWPKTIRRLLKQKE